MNIDLKIMEKTQFTVEPKQHPNINHGHPGQVHHSDRSGLLVSPGGSAIISPHNLTFTTNSPEQVIIMINTLIDIIMKIISIMKIIPIVLTFAIIVPSDHIPGL